MPRKTFDYALWVPCSSEMKRDIKEFAEKREISEAEAVRRLVRDQLHYIEWDRKHRRGGQLESMKRLGSSLLKRNPEWTLKHLTFEIASRTGNVVDLRVAKDAAQLALDANGKPQG